MDRQTSDWIDEALKKCAVADDKDQMIILRLKDEKGTCVVVSNMHQEEDVPFLRAMTAALNDMQLDNVGGDGE